MHEIPETRNKMRKSATVEMMNLMKSYIVAGQTDINKAKNSLIFAEYLLSRTEFLVQIAKDNDYYQNFEIYEKL